MNDRFQIADKDWHAEAAESGEDVGIGVAFSVLSVHLRLPDGPVIDLYSPNDHRLDVSVPIVALESKEEATNPTINFHLCVMEGGLR